MSLPDAPTVERAAAFLSERVLPRVQSTLGGFPVTVQFAGLGHFDHQVHEVTPSLCQLIGIVFDNLFVNPVNILSSRFCTPA